jgi:hypothetical protein
VTRPLSTATADALYERIKPQAKAVLAAFNEGLFKRGRDVAADIRTIVADAQPVGVDAEEQYLNDLFVLDGYVDFLSIYGDLWEKVVNGQFSSSWCSLQDALDLLRVIKRFSKIDVGFFEAQLTELERAYPYSVFASVGMMVDRFDCSICGFDIDSDDCGHMRGQLYRGVMAHAVARNILWTDHVALVTEPEDKRCVVKYEDQSDHFKLVRLLAGLIASRKWRLSDFSHLEYSKKLLPNPEHQHRGRNDLCFCESGKKFKKCCIGRTQIEQTHVDLVAVPRSIEAAVV